MQFHGAIAVLTLVCCAMQSDLWAVAGQSVIPGKFDVFNHNPVLLRDIEGNKDDQSNKVFPFGANNRAPLHDTPPSKCSCRELNAPTLDPEHLRLIYPFSPPLKDAANGTMRVALLVARQRASMNFPGWLG